MTLRYDPLSPEWQADPYPMYRRLRDEAPIYWSETARAFCVARYDDVLAVLPALGNPTISQLSDDRWVAINTVIEESVAKELFPALSEAGARAIVEYPLNKIVE